MHKYSLIPFLSLALLFSLTSCSDDEDDNAPSSSVASSNTHFFTYVEDWSSQFYMGVKLGELHTDIPDPALDCDPPEGYTLYLTDQNTTDDNGLAIYFLMADMDQVMQTTGSNQYNTVSISGKVKGVKSSDGKKVEMYSDIMVQFRRYLCPVATPDVLALSRYLSKVTRTGTGIWMHNSADNSSFTDDVQKSHYYDSEDSPLKISSNSQGDISYFNSSSSLPGWLQTSSSGHSLPSALDAAIWKTGANPEPVVYYVDDSSILCMAIEYDEAGDMTGVQRYSLSAY